jgi:cystathionine beta-lyase/cystathionine gamma-synthase
MLVIAETPSNPRLALANLAELGVIRGPFTVVDSTMATPLGQRPLDHGVNLVVHSATKGIGGHNDALLGVIAGERDLIDALWGYSVLHGAAASPFDALNGLRGIRTLPVRLQRQSETALTIARQLSAHPRVANVLYPLLESHPQYDLAKTQMKLGGSMLSLELSGGLDAARVFIEHLALAHPATSFGGPETLVCHPRTSTHVGLPESTLDEMGVTEGLVRISVGLEHVDDLLADINRALANIAP